MMGRSRMVLAGMITVMAAFGVPGTAAAQKPTKIKGVIVGRSGADMMVKSGSTTTTVTMNNSTKVEEKKGMLKLQKSTMAATALIPGLKVEVDGTPGANNTMVAQTVKFNAGDMATAAEIQAGVTPTQSEADSNKAAIAANQKAIAANQQAIAANKANEQALNARMNTMGNYVTKATATVYFANNSSALDTKSKADLSALAKQAAGINGYMIQVAGYADATGNAAYNDKLSDERAQNVIEYLEQTGNVPLYRMLAPAAMGTSHPAAANSTTEGQAENRRVVVTVLVNQAVAGS